jgi:hypothetical protein
MRREERRTLTRLSLHHRLGLLLGSVAAVLTLAAVAAASPGNGAVRVPVGNMPSDLGPEYCGFPIHVGIVSDNEYIIHDTVQADGTEILRITGKLVMSFTNENTGKSIVENTSGPGTITLPPDGSFVEAAEGNGAFPFDASDQASIGEPGLVFYSGHLVVTYPPTGAAQSFKLSGTQTNACALLGP